MDSLETENTVLREKCRQYKNELQNMQAKYSKIKTEYVGLVKKCVAYEMELQRFRRIYRDHPLPQPIDDNDSDSEQIQFRESMVMSMSGSKSSVPNFPVPKNLPLFQLFFVLQPFGDQRYQTRYTYPCKPGDHLLQLLKRLNTYIFPRGVNLELLDDDDQQSRHNELIFGDLFEEMLFVLENGGDKGIAIPALKQLNPEGKYFCYVFQRPARMNSDKKSILEGEIALCFITRFPFREFFKDVHKSMLQTFKLRYIRGERSEWKDYSIFKGVLEQMYETTIDNFPFARTFKTQNSDLRLKIDSSKSILQEDRNFAQHLLPKLSAPMLSQLLHNLLLQHHLLFFSSDKILLNHIFQFLRISLRPLSWPFAIVYALTEQLVPLLESPVPVLIGVNMSKEELQKSDYNIGDFVVLDLDQMRVVGHKQQQMLQGSVTALANHLETGDRLATLEWFVKSKLTIVKKGGEQMGEFEKQLRQTQMVEQYLLE